MKSKCFNSGQALVTLLVFMIIAITVTSAAVAVMVLNTRSSSKFQDGIVALHIAESGVENAILRMLRDTNYTGETNLAVGEGIVDIATVHDASDQDVIYATSTGKVRSFSRKIEIKARYENGLFNILSWREVI